MPIIIPSSDTNGLHERLIEAGATVMSQSQAAGQDIRPARIALLNLMPADAMERTETQWLRYMSHSILQIEPVLLKFDDDPRERAGASRADVLSHYQPFGEAADSKIDGLIVTGDNLELRNDSDSDAPELLPFDDISYASQLRHVIDWARSNVHSTIYSCLASHFAMDHLYGVEREVGRTKTFGVYKHRVSHTTASELTAGMDDSIRAPHSRWGNIPTAALGETAIGVLASNSKIGWLLAQDTNNAGGHDVYIQGHPEYDRLDLRAEHLRDGGADLGKPAGYYSRSGQPRLTWANDARALHDNWITTLYHHFSN